MGTGAIKTAPEGAPKEILREVLMTLRGGMYESVLGEAKDNRELTA